MYDYWIKKRNRVGKALLRRFQPPTSINDTSPHSTFRPREKEEKRIRRTRKNDKDAHKKLKHLQEDFRRCFCTLVLLMLMLVVACAGGAGALVLRRTRHPDCTPSAAHPVSLRSAQPAPCPWAWKRGRVARCEARGVGCVRAEDKRSALQPAGHARCCLARERESGKGGR